MANAATARSAIPIACTRDIGYSRVTPVVCTFDTIDSDLTIYTPNAARYAAIVGIVYQESAAHSLSFIAGSTTLVTLEVPANGPAYRVALGEGPIIVGGLGEALRLRCGTAAVSTVIVYCAEFQELVLH